MLARLRSLPAIADVRVECSGTFFLLALADTPDPDAAVAAVLDALGPGARRLADDEAASQLEPRRRGELWFSGEQIRALSYVEGRIITARALAAAVRDLSLTDRESEAIREAVRGEVFAAIDRVHDDGGRSSSGWFAEEWPHIVARAADRLADALPDAVLAEVRARLDREH